jgi:microfibrillar-associated protein 1
MSASEDTDDDSYEESESESEEDERCKIMKPVFIPKSNRITIQQRDAKAAQEEQLEAQKKQEAEARKSQTRVLVAESIRKMDELQELNADQVDSDTGMPDDKDEVDDDIEVS